MTRKKRIGLITLSAVLLVGGACGAVLWALLETPPFYRQVVNSQPNRAVRQQAAKKFVQQTIQLADDVKHADAWSVEFTQDQVNGWLAEELEQKYAELVPEGVRQPRVQFDEGLLRVGFRYEREHWGGVVSLSLRPWVPAANQLALEIISVRAGLLPIPFEELLRDFAEHFETNGWRLEWYEADGNDVMVLHLDRVNRGRPMLVALELSAGALRLAGGTQQQVADSRAAETEMGQKEPGGQTQSVEK
jgi:hypothetical protein